MPRYRISRWQVEIIDVGGIGLKERYRCYRCRRGTPEFTFDPCPRCGFDGPDTRGRWARFVDWARAVLGRA